MQFPSLGLGLDLNAAGAASEAARGAAEAQAAKLRQVQSLRQQAAQAAQQQQLDQEKQFTSDREMRKAGYVPYTEEGAPQNTGVVPGKGLIPRNTSPAAKGASDVITDPWGRKYVKSPESKGVTEQQGFSDLRSALNEGWQQPDQNGNVSQMPGVPRYRDDRAVDPNGPQNMVWDRNQAPVLTDTGRTGINAAPPDDWERLQTPGGGPALYRPRPAERAVDAERIAASKAGAEDAAKEENKTGVLPDSLTAAWEKRAGLAAGSLKGLQVPKAHLVELLKGLVTGEKVPHIERSTDDNGNVTTTAYEPSTGKKLWTDVQKGIGQRHRDPDAEPKPKPPNAADLRRITEDKARGLDQAERDFRKSLKDVEGLPPDMAAQTRKEAEDELLKSKQRVQDAYEEALGTAIGHPVQHVTIGNSKPNATNAAPTTDKSGDKAVDTSKDKTAAKPVQPQAKSGDKSAPASKRATLQNVRAFAAQKQISEAQAIKEFKAAGYTIGGGQ